MLYGSGYVLLAFLRGDFVHRLRWLTTHVAPLLVQRFVLPRAALEAVHAHLEALRAAGLDDRRAAQVVRSLLSYAMGYGLAEVTCCAPGLAEWVRMSERERLLCVARGLPEGVPGRSHRRRRRHLRRVRTGHVL